MYRYDAQRSAASPEQLPAKLHLQWVLGLPPLKPAWPEQPKLQLDAVYEPVVAGNLLIIGSSRYDTVTAYRTDTGLEAWRFFADGPIRYSPAVWQGKVYFSSDDGYLYCVDAAKGEVAHAWVVVRPGQSATAEELRMYCRERLAPYKVPAHIEFRSELPKTMVGKVLRRALVAESRR